MSAYEQAMTLLEREGIPYARVDHPAAFTAEQVQALHLDTGGVECRNLFLQNGRQDRYFLLMVANDKTVDLKALRAQLGCSHLGFASAQRLMDCLGVIPGAVSPLGAVHDWEGRVTVLLDADLDGAAGLCMHPNDNTATLTLAPGDLDRFLAACAHPARRVRIP